MPNLYIIQTRNKQGSASRLPGEKASVLYHNLFDYPMNFSDLIKWAPHEALHNYANQELPIVSKRGYSYLEGREGIIYKRILRKRISDKKIGIARRASKLLYFIPTVKMVAVTGSLAMHNASDESDIDLMIVAKEGSLWTTRLLSYFLLKTMNFALRKPNDKNQKDKLCLNMWLDESSLVWRDRNIYSAHEIAQIVPLVNKNKTYEKFLFKNKWILNYWPNSVRIKRKKELVMSPDSSLLSYFLILTEWIAFRLQYQHMKSKITREVVTANRALFHPHDWGKVVLNRLSS